jgi:predicted O-linked N-acetylglucosamine transferase (SPINDLY family)
VINYFFEAPLFHHRRDAFEITLYSTTVHMDSVTDRLRKRACRWRDVRFASDEQVARMVQRDGIDILVDLSGHTSMARPGLFALKPAPVQVTWLGYPNTTGLAAIDYRITDACADPPGSTERWHTEELVRLPHGFLCYRPRRSAPQVAEAPCLRTGTVTFGSCSKPLKWNCDVIRTWAAILRRVSGSRLLLHHSTEGGGAARVSEAFLALGVTPDRIEFTPGLDWRDHFQWFHRVDLALDPFPYNGTTASCETLWMGVPMIVLAGRSHVSRVGTSLLTRIGLERLIARSPEEYVDLAVRLAADCAGLAGLRAGMRERMRRSPLLDGPGFTSDLEDAYLAMWKRFRVGHGRAALSQNP